MYGSNVDEYNAVPSERLIERASFEIELDERDPAMYAINGNERLKQDGALLRILCFHQKQDYDFDDGH
jgi:hypothetical protein